jgi:DNA-3-methyladenine glycosylase
LDHQAHKVSASRLRLDRGVFNRPTLQVARDLLGKFIVRNDRGRRLSAMITEVEAYRGPRDRACHAYGGRRTPRVEPLYGDGGTVYVYLVYGMHWLLNFSTAGAEKPEGVLVRQFC